MSHAAKKASANGKPAEGDRILSLWERPGDAIFVLWYAVFWFSVMFTDIHNFTASMLGLEVHELEGRVNMWWPPRVLTDVYFKWARTIDPLLYQNPIWWQTIEWINLLCLMPTSVYALLAFAKGWESVRLPAIITNSFTWYSLMLCIFSTLYGPDRSPDPPMFLGIYVPYLIFPMVLIWRLWDERPFSHSRFAARRGWRRAVDAFALALAVATLSLFFYLCVRWFRQHTTLFDATLGPLDHALDYSANRIHDPSHGTRRLEL